SYLIGYITYCFLENGLKKYIDHFVHYTSSNSNNIKTAIDTLLMHQYHNLDTRKVPVLKEFKLGLFIDKDIKKTIYIINPYFAKSLQKSYLITLLNIKWFFANYGWKAILFHYYLIIL